MRSHQGKGGTRVSIIITGELGLDLDLIRNSRFRIARHGGPELVRAYFREWDDDPNSEASYLILWGRVEADHLANPERLNRALACLARRQGGQIFIPRKEWEKESKSVCICPHDLGVAIVA
jgi:hypothetical protein